MAGAATTYPYTQDFFRDGAYDPAIADAVNVMETSSGLKPPQGGVIATGGTRLTNIITQSLPDTYITTTLTPSSAAAAVTLVGFTQGQIITNLNLLSGTASVTQTHLWAAITTASGTVSGTVLAVSADGGTISTTLNGVQTFALTSAWTVPATGNYYVHVLSAASTVATWDAGAASAGLRGTLFPILAGAGGTSLGAPPAVGATLSTALTVGKPLAIYAN